MGTGGIIEIIFNKVFLINEKYKGEELPLIPGKSIFVDFINEIMGKGKCMIRPEDSFYVTEVAIKARESADSDKIILL